MLSSVKKKRKKKASVCVCCAPSVCVLASVACSRTGGSIDAAVFSCCLFVGKSRDGGYKKAAEHPERGISGGEGNRSFSSPPKNPKQTCGLGAGTRLRRSGRRLVGGIRRFINRQNEERWASKAGSLIEGSGGWRGGGVNGCWGTTDRSRDRRRRVRGSSVAAGFNQSLMLRRLAALLRNDAAVAAETTPPPLLSNPTQPRSHNSPRRDEREKIIGRKNRKLA